MRRPGRFEARNSANAKQLERGVCVTAARQIWKFEGDRGFGLKHAPRWCRLLSCGIAHQGSLVRGGWDLHRRAEKRMEKRHRASRDDG